jgi:DNA-binding response OmpR family regulator
VKTILIIEDEQSVAELLQTLLNIEYFTIAQASGEEAIMTIHYILPDLIILDMFLGEHRLSGLDTLRALREMEHVKDKPILVMSGRSDAQDIDHALWLGASSFISKPYSPMQLLMVVSDLLKQSGESEC